MDASSELGDGLAWYVARLDHRWFSKDGQRYLSRYRYGIVCVPHVHRQIERLCYRCFDHLWRSVVPRYQTQYEYERLFFRPLHAVRGFTHHSIDVDFSDDSSAHRTIYVQRRVRLCDDNLACMDRRHSLDVFTLVLSSTEFQGGYPRDKLHFLAILA